MTFHSVASFKITAYPSGSYNNVPDAVISQYLVEAESLILAACRVFHTLPLATGSYGLASPELAVLYNAQTTITSFQLQPYIGTHPTAGTQTDTILYNRYLEIMAEGGLLDRLSKGKLILPMEADATPKVSEKRMKSFGIAIVDRSNMYIDDNGNEFV
jgi:hypothetical protein